MKNSFKIIIIPFIFIIISIILGFIFNDKIIGSIVLISGGLHIWYQMIGKDYNYLFGIIFNIINAYISYINCLYGIFIFSILVYLPLSIYGYFTWKKIKNNETIIFKKIKKKELFKILILCSTLITIFTIILNIIPTQKLDFLDAASNILNICAMILMNYGFIEAWYILFLNNLMDLIIWILNMIKSTNNSYMMFIVSLLFFLINIYGIVKWKRYNIK